MKIMIMKGKTMSKKLEVSYNGKKSYDIIISSDFSELCDNIEALQVSKRRICIITDSNVAPLHLETIKDELQKLDNPIYSFVIPAGEDNKTLDTARNIWAYLIDNHFDRNDLLLALGGGVVGDVTGFTAACFLRGIKFIQVPTTLLADVDSSIGGKTGVDFDAYKNMIGAFHMPKLVYINISLLRSLSKRIFNSGMGEVIKHGLIKDADYFQFLIDYADKIKSLDDDTLVDMIYRSCEIKKDVVENDPTEKGERALLNFGHTLGHAIEKLSNFSLYHGECVILGCVCALYISLQRGMITKENYENALKCFKLYDFELSCNLTDAQEVVKVSKNDKKMDKNKIKFILLKSVGNAYIDTTVTDEEMLEALSNVLNNEK
jgi:3-dehydroquinate synthase